MLSAVMLYIILHDVRETTLFVDVDVTIEPEVVTSFRTRVNKQRTELQQFHANVVVMVTTLYKPTTELPLATFKTNKPCFGVFRTNRQRGNWT